jgi:hypothetical protein
LNADGAAGAGAEQGGEEEAVAGGEKMRLDMVLGYCVA